MGSGILPGVASALLFGTPRELTKEEIEGEGGIIQQFIDGARVAFEAGFKGVELHAACVFRALFLSHAYTSIEHETD